VFEHLGVHPLEQVRQAGRQGGMAAVHGLDAARHAHELEGIY
jgi:hypothetical protein